MFCMPYVTISYIKLKLFILHKRKYNLGSLLHYTFPCYILALEVIWNLPVCVEIAFLLVGEPIVFLSEKCCSFIPPCYKIKIWDRRVPAGCCLLSRVQNLEKVLTCDDAWICFSTLWLVSKHERIFIYQLFRERLPTIINLQNSETEDEQSDKENSHVTVSGGKYNSNNDDTPSSVPLDWNQVARYFISSYSIHLCMFTDSN